MSPAGGRPPDGKELARCLHLRWDEDTSMRIMIAYDGSSSANAAVEEVCKGSWPEKSEVRLVTVVEPQITISPMMGVEIYGPLFERMRTTVREEAYERIKAAMKRLETAPGLQLSYALLDGDIRRSLLDAIRAFKADMVVAGSHGASGLSRLFLGSVCQALVAHAPCHVLVIKMRESARQA